MSMLPADAHRRLHERSDELDAARYRWLRARLAHAILCSFPINPKTGFRPPIPYGMDAWSTGLDDAVDTFLALDNGPGWGRQELLP